MKMPAAARNSISPFPVSPSGGKPGRAGSPHAGSTLRGQPKALARIVAPAPPTRGLPPPLWIPCERGNAGLATLRDNREVRTHALAEIGRRWRIVYTKYLTLPVWANYSSEGDTPPGMVIRPRLIRVGAPH